MYIVDSVASYEEAGLLDEGKPNWVLIYLVPRYGLTTCFSMYDKQIKMVVNFIGFSQVDIVILVFLSINGIFVTYILMRKL